MATQVDIPFQGWSFSGQDQSKEGGTGLVQEMLDHGSISFGRYAMESLSWEKHSVFSDDTRKDELGKLTCPGLVARKKAYFEEYYKKIRALKALEENQPTEIQNSDEILTEHVEINPKANQIMQCKVNASIASVPESVMQTELHEDEKSGKEQLTLRNTTNRVEHEKNSKLDSDSLNTSRETEVVVQKDVHQSGITSRWQLVRRKIVDRVEHEKKLKQDFDSLSKDWVKLKNGMASIGKKESEESEIHDKKSKDTTMSQRNIPKQKISKFQIKSLKDPKKPTPKVNSGGQVAFNSRSNSFSSRNRPRTRANASLPGMNEATRVRSKAMEKSASNPTSSKGKSTRRSSLDSLMRPTAASNARRVKSEVKRNSRVVKKPLPSCVPKVSNRDATGTVLPKRRSFNKQAQDKPWARTRSDLAAKTPSHGKKPKESKGTIMGKKRVEPKKALDSYTRSKKLVATRKEDIPKYKRTKQNEYSPLKKKQRREQPPWR